MGLFWAQFPEMPPLTAVAKDWVGVTFLKYWPEEGAVLCRPHSPRFEVEPESNRVRCIHSVGRNVQLWLGLVGAAAAHEFVQLQVLLLRWARIGL